MRRTQRVAKACIALGLATGLLLTGCNTNKTGQTEANANGENSELVTEATTEATSEVSEETTVAVTTEEKEPAETTEEKTDGSSKKVQKLVNEDSANTDAAIDEFIYGDVSIVAGDDAHSVVSKLGEYSDTYEAPSCAFEGNDIVYTYDGFEVAVAAYNGQEVVVGCFLLDETVSTPAGISIGSTLVEVTEAYGEPDKDEFGTMTYKGEDAELIIVVQDDVVVNISYIGIFE